MLFPVEMGLIRFFSIDFTLLKYLIIVLQLCKYARKALQFLVLQNAKRGLYASYFTRKMVDMGILPHINASYTISRFLSTCQHFFTLFKHFFKHFYYNFFYSLAFSSLSHQHSLFYNLCLN